MSEGRALPSRGIVRAAGMIRMGGAMVLRSASGRWRVRRGADPEQIREQATRANAEQMRRTLGNLKGGAQKAGQLLSTIDSLLPAEHWRDAIGSLREDGLPVGFDVMEPVLIASLGPRWRNRFMDFDEVPVASASLGQVYRARWIDGADVAVKVQYPGVDRAVRADMRALGWTLRLAGLISPGMAAAPVARELAMRVEGELDYVAEGRAQRLFATVFADDQDFVVPEVVLARANVLITGWLAGEPLTGFGEHAGTAQRDAVGARFQRFALCAPARTGLLHADPHPGNFRVMTDGRLGVMDFGAVVPMPGGLPPTFGHLIAAMRSDDPAIVLSRLRASGLVRADAELDVMALMDFLGPFSDPARHEVFSFSPEWLRGQFARDHDPRSPDYTVAMQLTIPPEQLMTHRVWLGVVGVLSGLRATVPVLPELRRWLVGLE